MSSQPHLIENISEAVISTDLSFNIQSWNPAAERIYGWKMEEVIGKNMTQVVKTEYVNEDREAVLNKFQHEGFWKGEVVQYGKSGKAIDILASVSFIKKIDNEPIGVVAVNRDITGLKIANRKFETLISSIPDAIIMFDENGTIQFANNGASRIFEYKKGELFGEKVDVIIPNRYEVLNDKENFFESLFMEEIRGGKKLNGKRKTESEFPIEVNLSPIETEEGMRMIASIRDVTEMRKKATLELNEYANKLVGINEELKQFAYIATHDLKSPITNIESFLSLIKEDSTIKSERTLDSIDWLEKSLIQAKSIIGDLVSIVQANEQGELPLEKIVFEKMLSEVLSEAQAEINTIGAEMVFDFSGAEEVYYPRAHARSVLYNLVSNAIKYRDEKRKLKIEIKTRVEGQFICLTVKDNGLGINLKTSKNKIFSLFRRAHSHVKGSGLGLYMTKRAIERNKGRIDVESEVGIGTTFKVYFKVT